MVDHSGPCAKGLVFLTIFMVCMISCEGQSSEPGTESLTEYVTELATTIEPEVTTVVYPEVPVDLQITSITNESMKVTWTNTSAAWYNVSWSDGTVHGHNVAESPPYNIESLESGNRYNVSVQPCKTIEDCRPDSVSNSTITKPNKPRNLHVEVNRANSLNITWEKGDSVLAISHTVNISSSGSYEDHTTDGNNYVTGTLDANTHYKVEVFSTVKESPSPESEKTEKKETWTYPSPVNLIFNAESDYLEFIWDGSSAEAHVLVIHDNDNETCTRVEFGKRKTSCGDEKCGINITESGTGHKYKLNGTEPCGHYRALLYAANEAGCSNETEMDNTSLPAEPREKITGLQVTDVTESSMNVTWQPITYPARCEKTYTLMYSYYDCDGNENITRNISSGDQCYKAVDNLNPYTNYTFQVMAYTSEDAQPGNSESDPETEQTKEGTPGKPEDIEYDESNGFLTWNVPECKRNGEINSYRVNYTCFERDRPDNITENNGTITTDPEWKVDFEPYRTCSVSVEAKTTDWGDAGEAEISTPEDTPGKVDFSHTADNTSIQLDWEEPEDRNGIIISYTVEWKKSVASDWNSEVLSNTSRNFTITDLTPFTEYNVSVYASTSAGSGEKVVESVSTLTGLPSEVNVTVVAVTNSTISLAWKEPQEKNGAIESYTVQYCLALDCDACCSDGNDEAGSNSNECVEDILEMDDEVKVDFNYTITGLDPFTNYTVEVYANTSADRGESNCLITTTGPGLPGVVNFTVDGVTNKTISLSWEEPEEPNGVTESYTVKWTPCDCDSPQCDSPQCDSPQCDCAQCACELGPGNFSYTINNLQPYTNYTVEVYASNSAGTGQGKPRTVTTHTGIAIAVTGLNVSVDHNDSLKLDIAWNEGAITGDTKYTVCVTEADDVIKCRFNCTVLQGKNSTTIRMRYHYWVHSVEVITIVEQTDGSLSIATSNAVNETTGKAAPGSVTNLKARKQGDDCRHVSFEWEALDKHYHNGEFINYTIIVSRDDENIEEVALENYETTQTEVMVDGGKSYTVSIHAVNDCECEEGQKEDVDFTTNTCAPILEDTGANLVSESTEEVDDKQRTFPFQYNSTLFTDDSFGEVTLKGFLIREVTDKNESKANYSVQEFIGKYYSKWSDYYREDHTSYRINKTGDDSIDGSKRYLLGEERDCVGYCNGYLTPGKEYRIQMFSCTDGGCLVTADAKIQAKTADPTNNTPAIAIGVVVPLVVIMVLVIGAVVFRRRGGGKRARPIAMGNSRGQANPAFELKEPQPSGALYNLKKIARMRKMKKSRSKPVPLNRFQEKVNELHRDSDLKFSEEYKLLKEISPKNTWHAAEYPENRPKNRFTNILPFDHSRVKLLPEEDEDSGDYINANYMPGYNSKREFIAAQGPLPATKDDFWRMIWEQNIHTIIMLTRCLERGRPKCDQYWPTDSGEPIYYGDLECELKSESTLHNYTIRVMEISVGDRKRTVKQMHFTTWPDHGCPESTDDLLNFVQHVRQHVPYKANNQGPVLVHCSAGVGRTGTWICVDRLLQHIKDHEDVDIFGTVLEMRQYRCNMVQTEDQYIYIHDCIADAIQKGMHESTACYTVRAGPEGEEDEANLYENVDMKANGSANHA